LNNFNKIRDIVHGFIKENFTISGKIIEIQKKDDKWVSNFEIIEESEYVRKLGKTDIIGLYEVEISLDGQILGYKRLIVRERSDISIKV